MGQIPPPLPRVFPKPEAKAAPLQRLVLRDGDLELRTCDDTLSQHGVHNRAEIVRWEGATCFTIAAWERGYEGFYLRFVGSRPFEYTDRGDTCGCPHFWHLAKIGDAHLRAYLRERDCVSSPAAEPAVNSVDWNSWEYCKSFKVTPQRRWWKPWTWGLLPWKVEIEYVFNPERSK